MTDPQDERNLALASLAAKDQIDDLLKPTDERVRETVIVSLESIARWEPQNMGERVCLEAAKELEESE